MGRVVGLVMVALMVAAASAIPVSNSESASASRSRSRRQSGSDSDSHTYYPQYDYSTTEFPDYYPEYPEYQFFVHRPPYEGGPCNLTDNSRYAAHPHCDRFLQCQPGVDDSGIIYNFYVTQLCADGTRWDDGRKECVHGVCDNAGEREAAGGLCTVSGDPHFRMFDDQCWLHYQGLCRYVMARVNASKCSNYLPADLLNFTVESEHKSLGGNPNFGYLEYLHVTYRGNTYRMDPANSATVTLNGVEYDYTSPSLAVDGIVFRKVRGETTAHLPNGVSVSVRPAYSGKVRVPFILTGCMEGLCGNYNGVCGDDFILKNGTQLPYVHSNSNAVGNSWNTDATCADTSVPPNPTCDLPPYTQTCRTAFERNTLRGLPTVFENCSPDRVYSTNCQADICPFAGNNQTIEEEICRTIRLAMDAACDDIDLNPNNLPEYCKHCTSSLCQNEASCVELVDGYTCICQEGFQGQNCEININDCRPNSCHNGGTCHDQVNGFYCECPVGFTGERCGTNINDCTQDSCDNDGTCHDQVNGFYCECPVGFTGERCGTNINDCKQDSCYNDGTCHDQVNGFYCECPVGFTGERCGTNINDCTQDSCDNDGTCHDQVNGFYCECPVGFTGERCGTNINDCTQDSCDNDGTCHDQVNGFYCECPVGFTGERCGTNINDCTQDSCDNDGTCHDQVNGFYCECPVGFTGERCGTNINDCKQDSCYNDGTCHDQVNGFYCECPVGFTGERCGTNINDCTQDSCDNDGTCHDQVNGFYCECPVGFTGERCGTNINDCKQDSCYNDGTCHDQVNGFYCECPVGFTGERCGTNINDCKQDSCYNDGTCHDQVNGFYCECPVGFTGERCGTNINDCDPNSCDNGGTCHDQVNGFECECPDGYTGSNCETAELNECNLVCQNGAQCVLIDNQPTCQCTGDFIGNLCQGTCSGSTDPDVLNICACRGCDYGEDAPLNAVGYVADTSNCAAYYHCHRYQSASGGLGVTATKRFCAPGTIWDQGNVACSSPFQSSNPNCPRSYIEVSSTTTVSTANPTQCDGTPGQTLYRTDPNDCSKYYQEVCGSVIGQSTIYEKSCPVGLHFDQTNRVCNWPQLVNCGSPTPTPTPCTHPCVAPGITYCKTFPEIPKPAGCSFYYYTLLNQVTSSGVFDGSTSFCQVPSFVNKYLGGKLSVEVIFTCAGTNTLLPLVVNSDCQHDATFSLMLRSTTGGYHLEMHVVGDGGSSITVTSTAVTFVTGTQYTVLFTYDSADKEMKLKVDGTVRSTTTADLGLVKTGKAPLFIGHFDRDCANGRKRDYYQGTIHRVRVYETNVG